MIGRLAYGALFVVLLPTALWLWARRLDAIVELPVLHLPALGTALAAIGVAVTGWSMATLWTVGNGLPMNAYPPRRFVRAGPLSMA